MNQKNIIAYGQALAQALKAFNTLEQKAGLVEQVLLKILKRSYQGRLKHLLLVLPSDLAEAILTSDHRTGRTGIDAEAQEEDVTTIEKMIVQFVRDSGEAEITEQSGVRGVIFLDEAREFIPFNDLGYNGKLGFYKKSLFPDELDESDPDRPDWPDQSDPSG
jgi:hypothetical protein